MRRKGGKARLEYQVHRAVDPAYEVITAMEVTGADVNEAHLMVSLMEGHQNNTGIRAQTVVADNKYGTIENFIACWDRRVKAHMPDLKESQDSSGSREGIFSEQEFIYDKEADTYRCPAGKILRRKALHKGRQSIDYSASKSDCGVCSLRSQCTRNKSGRTVKRHLRQEELDEMRAIAKSAESRRDIKTRKHLMERSFARGKRYGFDRARWRGVWRVGIQQYITAAIQNIEILIRYGRDPRKTVAVGMLAEKMKGNTSIEFALLTKLLVVFIAANKVRARRELNLIASR